MGWILCRVVESSLFANSQTSFHTFLGMTFHIIGPRRNTKILAIWKSFSSSRGNSRFKHGSVIVHNIFAYFTLSLSASQVYMIKGKMLVLPKQLLYLVLSHIGLMFCFFPANYMSSTYTDKNNTFSRCTNKHSQLETTCPNRTSIGFSQTAFPISVLPKDDHKDFAQEERLGLPYWTMIWAICVVVDEFKCLDIPSL